MISLRKDHVLDNVKDFRLILRHVGHKYNNMLDILGNVIKSCTFSMDESEINLYKDDENIVSLPFVFGMSSVLSDPEHISVDKHSHMNPEHSLVKNYKFNTDLRKYQKDIVEETHQILREDKSILLELYTGFGKTVITCHMCCTILNKSRQESQNVSGYDKESQNASGYDNESRQESQNVSGYDKFDNIILILVNSTLIKEQWINTFSTMSNIELFNINVQTIDSVDLTKNKCFIIMKTYLVNHKSILDIVRPTHLIVDEADTFCTVVGIRSILSVFPQYIILLTATEQRMDNNNRFLKYLYKRKITKVFSGKLMVRKIQTMFKPKISVEKYSGRINWVDVVSSLCENSERNKFIIKIASSFIQAGRKILILTKRTQHVETLSEMASNIGLVNSKFYGSETSYNDSMLIIGTDKKLNRGFDEKSICQDFNNMRIDCLIMTYTIRNPYSLIQTIGRVVRSDNPVLIQLIDNHNILRKHWDENMLVYDKCGALVKTYSSGGKDNQESDEIHPRQNIRKTKYIEFKDILKSKIQKKV